MTTTTAPTPTSPYDIYSDQVLEDPYPVYADLRETGPAVWLPNVAKGVWALTRYQEVHEALRDGDTYRSRDGVALTDLVNEQFLNASVLGSDGEAHKRLRKPLSRQLNRSSIRKLTEWVERTADQRVAEYVARGTFDAVELAQTLVADIVMSLMGLPGQTRQELIEKAATIFDSLGPDNQRMQQALPVTGAMMGFLAQQVTRETVAEDSWMSAIYAAADAGEVEEHDVVLLMAAYVTAGMDNTIFGMTSAIEQLSRHPGQFDQLRAEPDLAENAAHEALRLESPILAFGRRLSRPVTIGDAHLDKDSRVVLMYASSGRDERKWGPDADTFHIDRADAADHHALGDGPHICPGNHLAVLEMRSILAALARHCSRIEVTGEPYRGLNNLLRGWAHLPVTVTLA
ncbi:cytochrome P450 [Streptomyces sp. B6B3]|uniref:cytochrome P450 n=1 Tax=Streptomyces sp. B6B3 TaxID=3153570 RepID=UPI00325C93DC